MFFVIACEVIGERRNKTIMEENKKLSVLQLAEEAMGNLIPKKSKKLYEKQYKSFLEWQSENNAVDDFSEEVFLAYMYYLSSTKKATTLWTTYSMLKKKMQTSHRINIDKYNNVINFLKNMSKHHVKEKANVFTEQEMKTFLSSAPNSTFLVAKVSITFFSLYEI